MAPVRYGVVGAGRVFQRYHLPCLRQRADVSLVALCDLDPAQAAAALGEEPGGPLITADLDTFFAEGRPDAIAVCTPNGLHLEPVLAGVAAGAAVFCEKPLAATLPDAERIAAAAERSSLFGVNLPYRFHPLLPAFTAALPAGECEIALVFTTPGQRLWRPVMNWYSDAARAGGGALLDLGSHALDLLAVLFGEPELVDCRLDSKGMDERAEVGLRFRTGPARVVIDRSSRRMELSLTVTGSSGAATLDIRHGVVRDASGAVLATTEVRPELAAIEGFLDAVTGSGGRVAGAGDALASQRLIGALYDRAAAG